MTPPLSALVRDGVLRVDNTAMTAIRRCPRYAYHQVALKRVPAREGIDLFFGKALHTAQEWRYKHCASRAMKNEEKAQQEAVLEKEFESAPVSEEEWQNLGRAKESIAYWNEEFQKEPFEVLETERGVERELGELGGDAVWCASCKSVNTVTYYGSCHGCGGLDTHPIKVNYIGRIDALVRYERKALGHDYKKMKERDWKVDAVKYGMSPQMKGYCFLASSLGYGPINDWWVDSIVVRKPLVKETAKSAKRNEFSRDQYHYTDAAIEEWRQDTLKFIETWLGYVVAGVPPMNTDACTQFFRPCCYHSVCSCPTEAQRMAWLNSGEFKPATFDPLAK